MVTRKENIQHAFKNGLKVNHKGEKHWRNKLTEKQVKEIKSKYIPKIYTQTMLAKEYGVSRSTVKFILNGTTWKYIAE